MSEIRYLRMNRAFLLFIGLWHLERKSTFYEIYRRIMIGYFCLYLIRQLIQLNYNIGKDNNEAFQTVGLSMMCMLTITKGLVCVSYGSMELVKTIKNRELKIFTAQKEKIMEIYLNYTKYNKTVMLSFYFCGLLATIAPIICPILKESFMGTSEKRPLPLGVWMPFDSQKYYVWAYLMQCIDSNFGCLFTVGSDTYLLSLMIFGVCQMKILNYTIRTCNNSEEIFEIIHDHLFIIKYVTDLNELMKTLMFLDFAMCSMHLAVLAFKVVVDEFNFDQFANITFAIAMLFELFLLYWHGNEIIIESANLSDAIWNSKWYEFSPNVKRTLLVMMMRMQKPLSLSASPFYQMSNTTFVLILRTTFSCITVFQQTYNMKR